MMNRKLIALLLSVMMLMTAASALAMTPGTYTGVAKGMFDGLTVEVTVTEDAITDVKVTEYQETAPGWPALEKIPADIVAAQTVEVDDVSGATMSSKGVKAAVRAALTEAGAAETDFAAAAETAIELAPDYFPVMGSFEVPETWDESYDVIVVGGGFAGLAAAYGAGTNSEDSVVLIEKLSTTGGNSAINGGQYAA